MVRLLVIISFFVSFSCFAQQVGRIDFDKIHRNISDSTSHFYYPKLLDRMWSNDTTLTHSDYKHLYYGSVFQPSYHPYGSSFIKKEFTDLYEKADYAASVEKGLMVMRENPVDIEVILKMLLSYYELGDRSMARVYTIHYYGFLDVIYGSGDGESIETAYVVISVDDEYRVVGDLDLSVKQQYLIDDTDLLIFNKRDQQTVWWKKIKQLYFNVHMPLLSLSKSFEDIELPEVDPHPDDEEEEEDE
jgi:hypothetical protein